MKNMIRPLLYFFLAIMSPLAVAFAENAVLGEITAGISKCVEANKETGTVYVSSGKTVLVLDQNLTQIAKISTRGFIHDLSYLSGMLYVGNAYGLEIIDVRIPESPQLLSGLKTIGEIKSISIAGTYAYILDVKAKLRVIDISDADHPEEVGSYAKLSDVNCAASAYTFNSICVSGNHAYLTDNQGLHVIDISTPEAPWEAGFYLIENGCGGPIAMAENRAYVVSNYSVLIIDISDPSSPQLIGTFKPEASYGLLYSDMAIYKKHLLVDAQGVGIYLIDVEDPSTAKVTACYQKTPHPFGIHISGDTAYLTTKDQGLIKLDLTGLSGFSTVSYASDYTSEIYASGTTIFLRGSGKTTIIDVSDPSTPEKTGELMTSSKSGVTGTLLYTLSGATLSLFDATDPSAVQEKGMIDLSPFTPDTVVQFGNYLYAADNDESTAGFVIIDASDPSDLKKINSYDADGEVDEIILTEQAGYIVDTSTSKNETTGFIAVDISDPLDIKETGRYASDEAFSRISVSGEYAYGISGNSRFVILDISNPETGIRKMGEYTASASILDFCVSTENAYLMISDNTGNATPCLHGIQVVNISNPATPLSSGYLDDPAIPDAMLSAEFFGISENRLYYKSKGVNVIDVSTPSTPEKLGEFYLPYGNMEVSLENKYAYASYKINDSYRLATVNLSDPADFPIHVKAVCELPEEAIELCVSGTTAIIKSGHKNADDVSMAGYRIFNISDPQQPVETGRYEISAGQIKGWQVDAALEGNYIYMVIGNSVKAFRVIDISDPANPFISGACATTFQYRNNILIKDKAYDMKLSGNYVFVPIQTEDKIYVMDVSDPTAPKELGTFNNDMSAGSLHISGNYAYSVEGGEFTIYGLSNLPDGEIISSYTTPDGSTITWFDETEERVCLVTDSDKAIIINVKDPQNPTLQQSYDIKIETDEYTGLLSFISDGHLAVSGSNEIYKLDLASMSISGTINGIDVSTTSSPAFIKSEDCFYIIEEDSNIAICRFPEATGTNVGTASGAIKWNCPVLNAGNKYAPAINIQDTIYITTGGRVLHAIDNSGLAQWDYALNDQYYTGVSSPAIDDAGTIYVSSPTFNNGCFYAFNADGSIKWEEQYVSGSLAIGGEGLAHVSLDTVCLMDTEGEKKWCYSETSADLNYMTIPAISDDETIYSATASGELMASVSANGESSVIFSTLDGSDISSIITGPEDTIYLHTTNDYGTTGTLYAIGSDGALKWSVDIEGEISKNGPAIGSDSTIYVGSSFNKLYAIATDGTKKWTFSTDGSITATPAVDTNNTIYIGDHSGTLYAINSNGTEKWRIANCCNGYSSPAIDSSGTLYIGSSLFLVSAINTGAAGLADSPWPMVQHDERHTSSGNYFSLPTDTPPEDDSKGDSGSGCFISSLRF